MVWIWVSVFQGLILDLSKCISRFNILSTQGGADECLRGSILVAPKQFCHAILCRLKLQYMWNQRFESRLKNEYTREHLHTYTHMHACIPAISSSQNTHVCIHIYMHTYIPAISSFRKALAIHELIRPGYDQPHGMSGQFDQLVQLKYDQFHSMSEIVSPTSANRVWSAS